MDLIEKTKGYLSKIEKENPKLNVFLQINPHVIEEAKKIEAKNKKGRLYGKIIGIKSNIHVKGLKCSCASKVLENYAAPYDATVIKKIKEEDGLIIGMLNMDEFACGSSGENSAFGPTQNPSAPGRITGGSSSGSAAAVAAGLCDIALGSDTGGSIRCPASHCGVIGLKPSYGLVSRHGLIDLSMSLDQIGPIAKTINEIRLMLEVIKGKDEKDTMSEATEKTNKLNKNPILGVIKLNSVDKSIQDLIDKKTEKVAKAINAKIKEINIPYIELAVQTYYPLVYAEIFSGTRKFDGRRFGKRIETVCGPELLRRIIGGKEITKAEFAGRYYQKALKIKKLIKKEFEKVFEKIDCIILPVVPVLPWKIGEGAKMSIEEIYASDALTIPANLAEICAISIPAGRIENIPIGIQLMCARFNEEILLNIAEKAEVNG